MVIYQLECYQKKVKSTVVQFTDELKKKGVISSYKKYDVQYYHTDSTKDLLFYLENEARQNEIKLDFLKANIEKLEVLRIFKDYKPNVEFFEGLEGVKKVYEKTLSASENIYAFFGKDFYTDELRHFIIEDYLPKRLKKQISIKALMQSNLFEESDLLQLRERKYIETLGELEVEINIFDEKIAFISYSDERYIGVTIEDKKIASALKTIHKLLWKTTY